MTWRKLADLQSQYLEVMVKEPYRRPQVANYGARGVVPKIPANQSLAKQQPIPKPQAGWKQALVEAAVTQPKEVMPHTPSGLDKTKPRRYGGGAWQLQALHAITITCAIALAAIAAYFSIGGMQRIFPGLGYSIIAMAAIMEGSKLIGAFWLSRNWRVTRWQFRFLLTGLLVILAAINAVGVYGQLSAAHLGPHVSTVSATNVLAVEKQVRIDAKAQEVAEDTRRIAQIDTAIEEVARRGRSSTFVELTNSQRADRAALIESRAHAQGELALLQAGAARIAADKQQADADIGILVYAADLFGADAERMIQLLILAMVLTCDPLAMTLAAATARKTA